MPLTVVVGSSGSGKTTFLEDVYKINMAVYVRQYHTLRPYIPVGKIPKFDPSKLPFWSLYSQKEALDGSGKKNASYNPNIKIGGTMAGEFTAGLSGGQRKMMLFELIRQRIADQSELLICLDEPFAGVTDDFVPFIIERLEEMRASHNIVLVTNDHVAKLTALADSIITVSAIDRSMVEVNGKQHDRELALHALSSGKRYKHELGNQDLWFFLDTEVISNPQLAGIVGVTVFTMLLLLLTFWDSKPGSEALVLVAVQIVVFFAINPYLIALCDWRNTMIEEASTGQHQPAPLSPAPQPRARSSSRGREAEALMHSSVQTNLALKSCVVLVLLTAICVFSFGILNACMQSGTLAGFEYMIFMLFDSAEATIPFICFGLYSRLPLQALRFLFARFYFWCKVPVVKLTMEGCPSEDLLLGFTVLTGCLGGIAFIVFTLIRMRVGGNRKNKKMQRERGSPQREKGSPSALRAIRWSGRPIPTLQLPPGEQPVSSSRKLLCSSGIGPDVLKAAPARNGAVAENRDVGQTALTEKVYIEVSVVKTAPAENRDVGRAALGKGDFDELEKALGDNYYDL